MSLDSRSTFSTNFSENAHFTIIAVVVVIVFALNKTWKMSILLKDRLFSCLRRSLFDSNLQSVVVFVIVLLVVRQELSFLREIDFHYWTIAFFGNVTDITMTRNDERSHSCMLLLLNMISIPNFLSDDIHKREIMLVSISEYSYNNRESPLKLYFMRHFLAYLCMCIK